MKTKKLLRAWVFTWTVLAFMLFVSSCLKEKVTVVPEPTSFLATNFVSGLKAPLGMTIDDKGQIWVTENGAGKNDGKVSVVSTSGVVSPAIIGFHSIISPEDGNPQGLTHLVYRDGKLYILHGVDGKLFTVDVSNFKIGAPIDASNLAGEDLGTFVKSKSLSKPINSNLYSLAFGPDGNLYIADAGANAIIKRVSNTGSLSVFARIPNINDSTESVPTGIVFNGSRFYVSTLSGFPFLDGSARIFQIDLSGNVSPFKTGYTLLTDIVLTANYKPLVLQFSKFSLATFSFLPMAGQILDGSGASLIKDLNFPTSLLRAGNRTYYVVSLASGTIQKLTY